MLFQVGKEGSSNLLFSLLGAAVQVEPFGISRSRCLLHHIKAVRFLAVVTTELEMAADPYHEKDGL